MNADIVKAWIVKAWKDAGQAWVVVRVAESSRNLQNETLSTEITASTPLLDAQGQAKSVAALKAELAAAARAAWAAESALRQPSAQAAIPWSGTVAVG